MSRRVPRAAAFAVAKVTTGGHVRCCSNRAVQRQLMASGHRTPQGRLGRQQRSVDQQCCILLARWCLSSQCLSRRSGCCTAATAASQATTREAAAIQLTQRHADTEAARRAAMPPKEAAAVQERNTQQHQARREDAAVRLHLGCILVHLIASWFICGHVSWVLLTVCGGHE